MDNFNFERELVVSLVLGGASPTTGEILSKITPPMISTPYWRDIYKIVKSQFDKGEIIDPVEVGNQTGDFDTFIVNLKSSAGSPSNSKAYAKRVRQGYYIREAQQKLHEATRMLADVTTPAQANDAFEHVIQMAQSLVVETDDKKPRVMREICEQYMDHIDALHRGESSARRVMSGIPELDDHTKGFNSSDLIVVGGTPGMGKSEFMMKLLRGATSDALGGLCFSLEMSDMQIAERAIAGEGGLSISKLRDPRGMFDEDWTAFNVGMSAMIDREIYVLDTPNLSVEEVCAKARRHKEDNPNLGMITVDYLGLMSIDKRERQDIALGSISRALKALAKEINTPVVLLVQLVSKEIEKRPASQRRPKPSDIKDSSRIEDDADWIIFPYRDEVYNPDSPLKGVAELIIAKARHATKATIFQSWINGHFAPPNMGVLALASRSNTQQSTSTYS